VAVGIYTLGLKVFQLRGLVAVIFFSGWLDLFLHLRLSCACNPPASLRPLPFFANSLAITGLTFLFTR
jgi:hypothetical protein